MHTIRRNDYVIYEDKICIVRDIYHDDYVLLRCVDNGQTYLAYIDDIKTY